MSGTTVPYDRELLELVTTYHPQLQDSRCLCGWGKLSTHLGRSHVAHVADVYELLAQGALLMGSTARGTVTHLTRDCFRSLCGRRLSDLVFRLDDGAPVPYAPHWDNDAVTYGHDLCTTCPGRSRGRERLPRPRAAARDGRGALRAGPAAAARADPGGKTVSEEETET